MFDMCAVRDANSYHCTALRSWDHQAVVDVADDVFLTRPHIMRKMTMIRISQK